MKRYHIAVKFDKEKIANIDFCKLHLIFTKHFKQRACLKRIPKPYKALLKRGKIFEYYTDDNEIGYKGGNDNPFGPDQGSSTAG